MKILLFGKNGQLGSELRRSLLALGPVSALDKEDLDLTNPQAVAGVIRTQRPAVIINASAYTAVDRAENEPEIAFKINAFAPEIMAQSASEIGAVFIHFSTDYVFDGTKNTLYCEDDQTNPINVYGQSKLEGEQRILQNAAAALIFRTSWVYSLSADNFVTKTLAWARQHETLRIVNDQIGSPTWARQLAETTSALVARAGKRPLDYIAERRGLYHLAGKGAVSRLEFSRQVLALDPHQADQRCREILPASTADFPTRARRPLFTALECSRFETVFDLNIISWQQALQLAMNS
ncbi:MAG: dTDP-4-dehydrorhamnose reductase [Anaerolineales bacterium]|jgi:dTDP-4-dehydrorhamnose reductase|nr:dTDP-4-dehydrorhamnose reductase [Anaerolineales bacterium]